MTTLWLGSTFSNPTAINPGQPPNSPCTPARFSVHYNLAPRRCPALPVPPYGWIRQKHPVRRPRVCDPWLPRQQSRKRRAGSPVSFRGRFPTYDSPSLPAPIDYTGAPTAVALSACPSLRSPMTRKEALGGLGRATDPPGRCRGAVLFAHLPYGRLTASILTRARAPRRPLPAGPSRSRQTDACQGSTAGESTEGG